MGTDLSTSHFTLVEFLLLVGFISNLFCLLLIASRTAKFQKANQTTQFQNHLIKTLIDNQHSQLQNTATLKNAILAKLDEINVQANKIHTTIDLAKYQNKQIKYNIIGANDLSTLENEIRKWQSLKWATTGGVASNNFYNENSEQLENYKYYQAIVQLKD